MVKKETLKIAFLLTQSLDSPSGLGRYFPLARQLARQEHQVSIYALHPDLGSLAQRHFTVDGVEVHYLAAMHVQKQGSAKRYYPTYKLVCVVAWATWKLCLAALRTQADIIHVCKPHPMNGLAGLAARYLGRKKLFVDCDDYEAGSGRFAASWQKRGVAFFERTVPGHACAVTTNTQFMRAKLVGWGIPAERVVHIPNGFDSERFPPPDPSQAQALRARLGLQGKSVVVYVGSLSLPSHPVDLLVKAFASVHAALPETALVLVGGGEDFDTLQRLVCSLGLETAVHLCGRVPPDQAPLYYQMADVSVDPVHDDDAARGRSPLKLFESWASQVPFVTADVGDRGVLLGSPPAGILSRPGDPDSLAESILQILQNPALASELRQRGLERAALYTWERLAEQFKCAYRQWK